jgi:ubiquinone/menaquinone biosynthesis C-methylase UbiE
LEHAASLEGEPITWARLYDLGITLMFLGRGRRMREKILDLALVKDGEGFLDVASGPGELVIAACERVGTLGGAFGVDLSLPMVRLAGKKAARRCRRAEFRQAPAQELPFEDSSFDAVTCVMAAHHFPGDHEKRRAFSEMRRVLRHDGRMVIVDFMVPKGRSAFLASHFSDGDMRRYPSLMRGAGFTRIDKGKVWVGPLYFVRGYADDGI